MRRTHSLWTQLVAAGCIVLIGCGDSKLGSKGAAMDVKLPVPAPELPDGPIRVPDKSIVESQELGTLPGELQVSAAGRAGYDIPLRVPEGRGGIQPELTLSFTDSNENGLLGVGWSLSGLSRISPCSRTTAQDGAPDAVHFERGDAYCLGGTRLVPVDGRNGDDGTVYRLERDNLVKIVSRGYHGSGVPDRFIAHHPDGTTWHYSRAVEATQVRYVDTDGGTPDQRTVVWSWALERVEDRIGNYMTFEYAVSSSAIPGGDLAYEGRFALEFYPTRIRYTAHDDGLDPRREIRFVYTLRRDPIDTYRSGVHRRIGKRLDRIEAYAPNPVDTDRVWYYELSYGRSSDTWRSLLEAVKLCDMFGKCLPPTTFEWTQGSDDYTRTDTGIHVVDGMQMTDLTPADFNGDGLTDLLFWDGEAGWCDCVGACDELQWTHSGYTCDNLGAFYAEGEWSIAYSDGTTLVDIEPTGLRAHFTTRPPGDGISPEYRVALEHGTGPQEYNKPIVLDFDGDGAADLLSARTGEVISPSKGYAVLQDLGSTFEHLPPDWEPDVRYLADFDGDGRVDLFRNDNRSAPTGWDSDGYIHSWNDIDDWDEFDWSYQLGGGEPGFGSRRPAGIRPFMQRFDHYLGAPAVDPVHLGITMDVDGDGRTELALPAPSNRYKTFEIAADGSPEIADLNLPYLWESIPGVTPVSEYVPIYLDINGDGLRDVIASGGVDRGSGYIELLARINTGRGYGPWYVASRGAYRRPPSPWESGGPAIHDNGVRVFDYNGDGLDDFIVPGEGGEDPLIYRSDGRQFSAMRAGFDLAPPVGRRPPGEDSQFLGYTHRFGDIDGDGKADLFEISGTEIRIWQRDDGGPLKDNDERIDALSRITNGLGKVTWLARSPLRPLNSYTPGTGCSYPQRCLRAGGHVVTFVHRDTPGEDTFYDYEDGRVDMTGRGFVGFGRVVMKRYGLKRTTVEYDVGRREHGAYPVSGMPISVRKDIPIDVHSNYRTTIELTEHETEWSFGDRVYRVRPRRTSHQVHDVTTSPGRPPGALAEADADRLSVVFRTWDEYGNLDTEQTMRSGWIEPEGGGARVHEMGTRTTKKFDYLNDEREWLIGVRTLEIVESAVAPAYTATTTRTTEIVPDAHGRPRRVILEPNDPRLRHETTYHYGRYGQLEQVDRENSPSDPEAPHQVRTDKLRYDDEQLYPDTRCNALGHCSRLAVHPALGVLVMVDDPNGYRTATRYDGFGRIRSTITSGGQFEVVDYLPSLGGAIATRSVKNTGEEYTAEYLRTGHLFRLVRRAFDGGEATRDIEYDIHGKVKWASNWYVDPARRVWTTYDYDGLDRVIKADGPNGTTITKYATDEVRTIDAIGNESYVRYDVDNQISDSVDVYSEDGSLVRTSYGYGPFGLTQVVVDPLGHKKKMKYDRLGRRIALYDPDAGSRSFTYNGFGELIKSVDPQSAAAGVETTYERDLLGRVLAIKSIDGVDTFTWDAPPAGSGGRPWIGARHAAVSADGTETRREYDALGRPHRVRTKVHGTWFDIDYGYDAHSQLTSITYPAATGAPRFEVRRSYGADGSLARLWTRDEHGNKVSIWQATERDADRRATRELYGDNVEAIRDYVVGTGRIGSIRARKIGSSTDLFSFGYKYYANGNIRDRFEGRSGFHEHFRYDSLDRLVRWERGEALGYSTTYTYDPGGNLEQRVGRGPTGRIEERFLHEERGNDRDHLTRYTRWVDGTRTIDTEMDYDDNGRRIKGPWDEVSYTRFDLPRHIVKDGKTTKYRYDADGNRVAEEGPDGIEVRVSQLYERHKGDGVDEHVFLVRSDTGVVAQVVQKEGDSFRQFLYTHRDHRGTAAMVTDDSGDVWSTQWFTPFGQRAYGEGRPSFGDFGDRVVPGFTGHRNDDQLGLIDMNGRVYDPLSSTFLTPDPIVSRPLSGQDHNRYSYALNNPVNYIDPTGLQEDELPPLVEEPVMRDGVLYMPPFVFPYEPDDDVESADGAESAGGSDSANDSSSVDDTGSSDDTTSGSGSTVIVSLEFDIEATYTEHVGEDLLEWMFPGHGAEHATVGRAQLRFAYRYDANGHPVVTTAEQGGGGAPDNEPELNVGVGVNMEVGDEVVNGGRFIRFEIVIRGPSVASGSSTSRGVSLGGDDGEVSLSGTDSATSTSAANTHQASGIIFVPGESGTCVELVTRPSLGGATIQYLDSWGGDIDTARIDIRGPDWTVEFR